MTCPECRATVPPTAVFCPQCGAALTAPCPGCGTSAAPDHRFCARCGAPLAGVDARESPLEPPDAERRQLTVMFCDLVGSTALAGRLDPEELRDLVGRYQAAAAHVIERAGGHIAQYLGDGLLVYFGYPRAREDDARRAVRAALEVVDAVAALAAEAAPAAEPLAVRVGLHTGPVVVGQVGAGGRHEALAIGETPNVAARVQELAEPGAVLISGATYRLVRGLFTCEPLGPRALRGVLQALEIYRVRAAATEPAADIPLTPLVGREQEIGLLLDRWELARDGRGQVVLLIGEPGIGKSRLIHALRTRLAAEPHTLLEARCAPDAQSSALYPWRELLGRLFRFERTDDLPERMAKLAAGLVQYGLGTPDTVALLGGLLAAPCAEPAPSELLPSARARQQLLETLQDLVLRLAEDVPLALVVEDLHWVDPSTLELTEALVRQAPAVTLLLVLTARPEFRLGAALRASVTQIALNRLTRRQAVALVGTLTGGKRLPPDVELEIVTKTDGVPLFVEELTKAVLESGWLREEETRWVTVGPRHPLAVPATLQDSLMARLDRLGPAKTVAQMAAVLGREFPPDLLQAVAGLDEGTLRAGLEQLVAAELVFRRSTGSHPTYLFKHGLVQDAAYQSLLRSARQRYHRRAAEALQAQFPQVAEGQPELVAHHLTRAGLTDPAVAWWLRASRQAVARSAHREAIRHLSAGLELVRTQPDTEERARAELELTTSLGAVLMAVHGYAAPDVGQAYRRARELCERLGDAGELYGVLRGLWGYHVVRAELDSALELAERCRNLAEASRRRAALVWAHYALGMTRFHRGELAAARQAFERSLELYDRAQPRTPRALQDPGVACLSYLAVVRWLQGAPDDAERFRADARVLAEALAHPFSLAYTLSLGAVVSQFAGEPEEVARQAAAAGTLSARHGLGYFLPWAPILGGWALGVRGATEAGLTQQREGLAAYAATGAELARPYFLVLLAENHAAAGELERALALLAEARAGAHRTGERWFDAEIHRWEGALRWQRWPGETETAEACFTHALEVARGQGAVALELRAAVSLAHLQRDRGRGETARRVLTAVCERFPGGMGTRDGRTAAELLRELV